MARLPIPGQDEGTWGDILNEYLSQVHKADGSLKDNTVTSASLAPDAVDSTVVQDESVTTTKIADSAITEDKLDAALQAKVNAAAGISDHGALTGLGDDDHPQYLNNTRGDARYYTKSQSDAQLTGKVNTNDSRLTDARTPTAHASSHASAGSDPIAPADIGAATTDDVTDALAAHVAASDPHPGYLTQSEGDGRYAQTADLGNYATDTELANGLATKANTSHTHAVSDVTNLQTTLDGKAATSHTHAIANVTGLQTALDGKAASSHTHAIADTTGLQSVLDDKASSSHTHAIGSLSGVALTTPSNGQVLKYNGTTWVNDDDLAGSGATNLDVIYTANDVIVTSSSGDDATIAAADATNAGVMVATDKTKLDGIEAGAEVNTVASVAGKTGAVTLDKTDVGLGNVPNTDATSRANHTGMQAASTISDLNEAVDDRVSALISAGTGITKSYDDNAGTLTISATGNTTAAQVAFTPDGDIAANDVQEAIQEVRDDTDTKLADKSDIGHTHDNRYYTETETDTLLSGKASTSHTHAANDLTDVTISSPSNGQVLKYNGTVWVNDSDSNVGTNLGSSRDGTSVTVTSNTGDDATLAAADSTNAGVMTAADKTKLDGIEAGADVTDATNVAAAGAFIKASDDLDDISEGTTNKHFTATEKTKLSGIATGATANSSDAMLLARANHTGTQAASTISDFSEAVDDRMNALLVAGTGISKTYDDVANTLTITATGNTTASQVTFTPNGDIAATDVQAALQEVRNDTDTKLAGKSNTGHTHAISDTTGLQTALDNKLDDSQRGTASGVASLDSGTKVPIAELPTGSTSTTVSLGNHTHANYQDTSQKGAASGYASLDSNTKVPTAQIPLSLGAVTLTDGATVATNAAQGNLFRLSMSGNRTLSAPTNPTDGQKAIWEVTASGADRTLTLATGAGGFAFGTTITALTATTSATTDYIGAVYNSTANCWRVIAYVKGY